MTDSGEWFRQAQYDLDTAGSLIASGRYPPAVFFIHLALEKALKALYAEKFNDVPEKTHNLSVSSNLPDWSSRLIFLIPSLLSTVPALRAGIPITFKRFLNNIQEKRLKNCCQIPGRFSHG